MKAFFGHAVLCCLVVAVASAAGAATLDVCPSGCSYTTIQSAIAAATAGDTIAIGQGTYAENLVVDKAVTLQRAARWQHPLVVPAVSSPNPCAGSSLCGGLASNIVLIQSDNVTIDGLTLDGDNPSLTSGQVVGGADIDARNGVITDNSLSGAFNNLTVRNVVVRNVFLRGIYASNGGTFDFHDNVVSNVQGEYASIAIFNYGGAGVMAGNFVSDASDAVSSNHSRGVQFVRNIVVRSGSGVHTDNAGDGGGSADLIRWNAVSDCTTDGYGVWVFVPYIAPTVRDNIVLGCAVGLAAFGEGAVVTPSFTSNIVSGHKAATSTPDSSLGVLMSTDILGYGSTDTTVSFSHNAITKFSTGIYVEQHCELFGSYYPSDCSTPHQATATFRSNIINGNDVGANGLSGTAVDAKLNWWGCSKGPNHPGCDTAVGTVTFTPWLKFPPLPLP